MSNINLSNLIEERRILNRLGRRRFNETWELLKKYRTNVDKREYRILKALLYEGKNLTEVGKDYGVTRERIRQISDKTIEIIDKLIKYE